MVSIEAPRNVLIEMNRDEHPCTYSVFDPLNLACQFCGVKRKNPSEQGFHTGDLHFDGTFETDAPIELGGYVALPTELPDVPLLVTAVEHTFGLDGVVVQYTVTATKRGRYPM